MIQAIELTNGIAMETYRANLSGRRSLRGNLGFLFRKFLQFIAGQWWVMPGWRARLQALKGVHFADKNRVFLGENVYFDNLFPQSIYVGCNVMITQEVMVLAHFYDPSFSDHVQRRGKVRIEDDVYIGARSLIVKPVTIGQGAVVAANSVVNSDVAPYAIVAGSPARVVGRRGDQDPSGIGPLTYFSDIEDR
jgi:acetyltransferase-like isoleucine patch superfamily enzyme